MDADFHACHFLCSHLDSVWDPHLNISAGRPSSPEALLFLSFVMTELRVFYRW